MPAPTLSNTNRVIRDPDFAKRLTQACDALPLIPPKHSGRQSWIQREMTKAGEEITSETVRKWFQGEAKPRPDKVAKLAQILQVDVSWLSLGVGAAVEPRQRRVRNAMADGAVNLVAGLIQMDGGHLAFPDSIDTPVDLHAIIKGAKYDLHVSLGEVEGKAATFPVPVRHEEVLELGVLRRGMTIDIIEITSEMIDAGKPAAGGINVTVSLSEVEKARIEGFSRRL